MGGRTEVLLSVLGGGGGVGVGLQVIRTGTNEVFPITPGTSSRSSLTFLCFLLFFFWENCNSLRNSGLRRSRRRFEELL